MKTIVYFPNTLSYKNSNFPCFFKKDFNLFIGSLLGARPHREK